MPSGSGRSSLIGVAISLIGNILISLALNCQKLAHVRLEREGNDGGGEQQALGQENGSSENQALLHPSTSSQNSPNYGTSQGGPDHGKKTNGASQTHNEEGQGPQNESMSTTFLKSKLWWVGISLMTLGEFGNFLCRCLFENGVCYPRHLMLINFFFFSISLWICASFTCCSFGRSCTIVKCHHFTHHAKGAFLSFRYWWNPLGHHWSSHCCIQLETERCNTQS